MGKSTSTMLAALVAVGMLTGCSGTGDEGGGEATSSTSTSAEESEGASEETEGSPEGSEEELDEAAEEAGVDPDNPPEPVDRVTVRAPGPDGEGDTEATIDLYPLKRDGDLLILTMGFTPSEGEAKNYYRWMSNTTWRPQIIDTTNLTVHDVVKAPSPVVTPSTGVKVAGGQTLHMFAVFAAPPEDVETVTVNAVETAAPFTDVEIP